MRRLMQMISKTGLNRLRLPKVPFRSKGPADNMLFGILTAALVICVLMAG
jgi:hypothetical protein